MCYIKYVKINKLNPCSAQPVAEWAGLGEAEAGGLLGVGEGGAAVAPGEAGECEVVVDPAERRAVGGDLQRAGEVGDRLVGAAGLVGEDAPVQERGGEARVEPGGLRVVAGGLVRVAEGVVGQAEVEVAGGGRRLQRDAGPER